MVHPRKLVPGNVYFVMSYCDQNLLVPTIDTLMFVEREDSDSGRVWLFREPPFTDEHGNAVEDEDSGVTSFGVEQLYQVLEFPELIETLREVAPLHPLQPGSEPDPPMEVYKELRHRIEEFIGEPEYLGLTITILYTDNGFSIGRQDNGFHLSFYPSVGLGSRHEARLRALLASLGKMPSVDYTANRGRVRVLNFPVSGELDELCELCERILLEAYEIRSDDSLAFHLLPRSSLGQVT